MLVLVHEVMTTPVVTIGPDDSIRRAARVLLDNGIASAPVVDPDGMLLGVVSEADLMRGRTEPDPRAHLIPAHDLDDTPAGTVTGVMTTSVVTIRPDEDVASAARLLLERGIKAVPVVRAGRVVGILARRDVLRSLARDDDAIRDDIARLFSDLGLGDTWGIDVDDGVVVLSGPDEPEAQRAAAVLARTVPGVVRLRHVGGAPL